MPRSSDGGRAIQDAVERLRAELGDPAALIVVLSPSAVTKEIARRALGAAGPFIRVGFTTPGELVTQLGDIALLRSGRSPEPEGWLTTAILAHLHRLATDSVFAERAGMLLAPGWLPTLSHVVRALEGAGVTAEQLSTLDGDFDRLELLQVFAREVSAARERERLYSYADSCRSAQAGVHDARLPVNRARGVIVLGDAALAHVEFEAIEAGSRRDTGSASWFIRWRTSLRRRSACGKRAHLFPRSRSGSRSTTLSVMCGAISLPLL